MRAEIPKLGFVDILHYGTSEVSKLKSVNIDEMFTGKRNRGRLSLLDGIEVNVMEMSPKKIPKLGGECAKSDVMMRQRQITHPHK